MTESKSQSLYDAYEKFIRTYGINDDEHNENLADMIKMGLHEFISSHKKVAIYCYGLHTKMLMSDFMFELKDIKYIVENYNTINESGFEIITDSQLEDKEIDGVIISSFKFKDRIKEHMKKTHRDVDVFDLYDCLEKQGIHIASDYYRCNHPYDHYREINYLRREIASNRNDSAMLQKLYRDLVCEFIWLKDFRLASEAARALYSITDNPANQAMADELNRLYKLELELVRSLNKDHVLMLCIDGLRRESLCGWLMPGVSKVLKEKALLFSNAYSYSTSTFESLLPVYSENFNQKTKYYNKNYVAGNECRFLEKAKDTSRNIHFYTQTDKIVEDEGIEYTLFPSSISQILWRFLKDASSEEKGLYYIHVLYESHYSFSNPYTSDKLIAEGTAMLFDFLEKHGGKLRTDYEKQNKDAIKYIDDTLAPFIEALPCSFVLYADHGNILLNKDTTLHDVHINYLTCHENWIRIPLAIYSQEIEPGINDELISLTKINDILISLMENRAYTYSVPEYIKIARSELYNPDFRYLYKQLGEERRLLAFEGFIFPSGYKLIVYADGSLELFDLEDNEIADLQKANSFLQEVKKDITVTDKFNAEV